MSLRPPDFPAGDGESLCRARRGERRKQPRKPGPRQPRCPLRLRRHLAHPFGPTTPGRRAFGHARELQRSAGSPVTRPRGGTGESGGEQPEVSQRESIDADAVRQPARDVQHLGADGPRAAENTDCADFRRVQGREILLLSRRSRDRPARGRAVQIRLRTRLASGRPRPGSEPLPRTF